MKKVSFLYPTDDGDIVLSGYPSWVCHSDTYPFRIYTFLLDERSSARIEETSVSLNTLDLLSDENECESQETSGLFTGNLHSEQLTLNFTPWRR